MKSDAQTSREARIATLRAENADALAVPLMSEGSISPMQVGMMSKRQRAVWEEKTMRRMRVEAKIRDLSRSDEEIATAEAAARRAKAEAEIEQLRRSISNVETLVPRKKNGDLRPSSLRSIDLMQAEIAKLEAALGKAGEA